MLWLLASSLGLLLHVCQAQYSCTPATCDSLATRQEQKGCRTFCHWADTQGRFITLDSLRARFDTIRDPLFDDIDRQTFVSDFTTATGMCAPEARGVFRFITLNGGRDPDYIQPGDVDDLWFFFLESQEGNQAQCIITSDSGVPEYNVSGLVMYSQTASGGDVTVDIDIEGFTPNASLPKHGFHVHENPATGNQCGDSGGHYNPYGEDHGAPYNTSRHVGDLGNIQEGTDGKIVTSLTDWVISLRPEDDPFYVIDRANNIHAGEDDLGLGGDESSRANGNAGPRAGCCIIEAFDSAQAVSKRGFDPSWDDIYALAGDPLCPT